MSGLDTCTAATDCGPNALDCVNQKCVCQNFWSTDMDFLNFEYCATNVIAIYILWGLNLAEILWVLYKSTWVIFARFENFFEQRRNKRNYTLWQNKGLIAVILEFGISMPAQAIMSILHFVQPTTRIGFDVFPTVLFFVSKLGFYACIVFVQGPMLAVTLKGEKNKDHIVRMGYTANTISATLSIIIGALPFITLTIFFLDGFENQQLAIMQSYYFCQASAMVINLVLSIFVLKKVNEVLDRAEHLVSSDQNIKTKNQGIREKINALQTSAAKQAGVQGFIYILMGSIPFFWVYHAYFLPISWLAMPLLGMKLAHQVTLDKKGSKTIMQRLGIVKTSSGGHDDRGASSLVGGDGTNADKHLATYNPMSSQAQGRKLQSSVVSESTQLEELLSPDHPANAQFQEFVKKRFATSELELLNQCLQYKRAGTPKERKRIGNIIMKTFVVDGSPKQVDLPDEVKKSLMSTAAKSMFVETTFDQVRGPLVFEIKGNFFAPFEKKMSMNDFSASG